MSADILQFAPVSQAPNRIRELRMEAELSQEALGQAIGVTKVTISDLEKGKMALTLDYMRRIAAALDVAATDLMPREDNPDALTHEERQWIVQLRAASPEQREQLAKVADVIAPFRGPEPEADRLLPRRRA